MRGYRKLDLRLLAVLMLLSFASVGCKGQTIVDPPASFKGLNSQDYEFQVVWEVCLEAMKELEFRVEATDKDAAGRKGVIISGMRIQKVVRLEGQEVAQRLRIEIKPGAGTAHDITVAASEWKRKVTEAEGALLWESIGKAEGLHDEFESTLEKQFSKRYKSKKE